MKILKLLNENLINDYLREKNTNERIIKKKVGDLNVLTGTLIMNDPLVFYEVEPFDKKVECGVYPIYIYEHVLNDHTVNGFMEICFCEDDSLSFEKIMDFEVESGTIGFMDASIGNQLMSLTDEEAEELWQNLNNMFETEHRIDYQIGNINMIGVCSGYGNGVYTCYYGMNEQQQLCRIIVDFKTIVDGNIDYSRQPKYYWGSSFDEGEWHYKKIIKDQLALNRLAGYNHLAIYLRWAMEHHLLSESLLKWFPELPSIIMQKKIDIREILDQSPIFEGKLSKEHFNELGKEFTDDFYRFNMFSTDYYPTCVDDWAETFLGSEKYHCEEYKDEAYLFVPYDEVYYQGLSKYIDKKWKEFINNKYQ